MRGTFGVRTRTDAIAETLRSTIIPGLLKERAIARDCEIVASDADFDRLHYCEVGRFTETLLSGCETDAAKLFCRHLDAGIPASLLFNNLLAGSARLLGDMWVSDECLFADVTRGLTVIHRLLHMKGETLSGELPAVSGEPLILITPIPGEHHLLAAAILGEFFSAARWRVRSGIGESWAGLLRCVSERPFDVIGVTVSSSRTIDDCERLIGEMRARSCNASVKILVGGPPFAEDPDDHQRIGADATADNALSALMMAEAVCSAEECTSP